MYEVISIDFSIVEMCMVSATAWYLSVHRETKFFHLAFITCISIIFVMGFIVGGGSFGSLVKEPQEQLILIFLKYWLRSGKTSEGQDGRCQRQGVESTNRHL
jgi:hypothetical protein